MKINMAIYTAQEGYSWQPGSSLSAAELKGYKECIGKFPSPDAVDFPFGGVFLKDDKVVFYRYHIAKKIDFRGRDALYCALGVIPKDVAHKVNPVLIFALPQFAGPVKPFPVEAEIGDADPLAVPEWLKNLDRKTLDVRISSSAKGIEDWKVAQKDVPLPPKPEPVEKPKAEELVRVSPAPSGESTTKPVTQGLSGNSGMRPTSIVSVPARGLPLRLILILALSVVTLLAVVVLLVHAIFFGDSKKEEPKEQGIAASLQAVRDEMKAEGRAATAVDAKKDKAEAATRK